MIHLMSSHVSLSPKVWHQRRRRGGGGQVDGQPTNADTAPQEAEGRVSARGVGQQLPRAEQLPGPRRAVRLSASSLLAAN